MNGILTCALCLVQPDGSHEWNSEEEVWGGGGGITLLLTEGVWGGDIQHWERRQQRQRQPVSLTLQPCFISIILIINTRTAADRWDSYQTLWGDILRELRQFSIITDQIFKWKNSRVSAGLMKVNGRLFLRPFEEKLNGT